MLRNFRTLLLADSQGNVVHQVSKHKEHVWNSETLANWVQLYTQQGLLKINDYSSLYIPTNRYIRHVCEFWRKMVKSSCCCQRRYILIIFQRKYDGVTHQEMLVYTPASKESFEVLLHCLTKFPYFRELCREEKKKKTEWEQNV